MNGKVVHGLNNSYLNNITRSLSISNHELSVDTISILYRFNINPTEILICICKDPGHICLRDSKTIRF